jgi:hypothetical protein
MAEVKLSPRVMEVKQKPSTSLTLETTTPAGNNTTGYNFSFLRKGVNTSEALTKT